MSEHMEQELADFATAILDDGIIDAAEVSKIRERVYADGIVDREEADFLFELNDATSGADNDASWQALFVEALSDHVLKDEISPGVIDEDEAAYLVSKIEADGVVDGNELALLVNIAATGQGAPDSFNAFVLSSLKAAVLEDGIIDEAEVEMIRKVIYGKGGAGGAAVERVEADFLFDLNDAASGKENHPSWKDLFVEAVSSHVLEDEVSPGEIDEDEASYLRSKIEADGVVDANELALMVNIIATAESTTDEFINFVLSSLKAAVLEDGIIDEAEVEMIRKVIYGKGGAGGAAVERVEADFLFDLNDAASGKENHPSWKDLFVEAVSSHVLEDEVSPGEIDADEAEWLIGHIEGDEVYDETEKALLKNIKEKSTSVAGKLKFKLDLFQI